ncbi:MAG: hypothetical protein ACLFTK_09615 [Anaerolineales bacterium]
MKPPEKPQMAPYFVDRHHYVETFFHRLNQYDIVQFVGDTYSRYGTGKTTILSTLYYRIEADYPHLKPLWLSLDQFSAHYQNPQVAEGNTPQTGALVSTQNIIDYTALLGELAQDCLPQVSNFKQLMHHATLDILRPLQDSHEGLRARDLAQVSSADAWKIVAEAALEDELAWPDVLHAIEQAVQALTDLFLDYYNLNAQQVILFADDYCWLSDQPIGDWVLNHLTANMQQTAVIISRTTEQLALQDTTRQVENLRLANFTPEDIAWYLHQRLNDSVLPSPLVEHIYHFSKGHAQTVSLAADLLATSQASGSALVFPRLEEQAYTEMIPSLVMSIIDGVPHAAWLREALSLGIVARRFDMDLLYQVLYRDDYQAELEAGLLHEEDVEARKIDPAARDADDEVDEALQQRLESAIKSRILDEITRFSFVEAYHDDAGIYYAFHNSLRGVVDAYLAQYAPVRHIELHQRLADAYADILNGYEEQDPAERYVAMYRVEDPVWQRTVAEWLYHLTFIRDTAEADFEFLNIYFTAHQWWGFYLPFAFCEHILAHWRWVQADETPSAILGWVQRFHEIVPRGFQKDIIGDPRWDEVRALILQMAQAYDLLSVDPDTLDEKRRALRVALSENYNWCLRFAPQPDYEQAIKLYRESAALAEEDGDIYNQSYQLAYLADMYVEMGRYDEAYTVAAQVNALMDVHGPFDLEKDYEVLTLSSRVMGDACLLGGRYTEVTDLYRLASMCAYAQNYEMMHPPDPYTIQWHNDTIGYMARLLIQQAQADPQAPIEAICRGIHAHWHSYWQENGCSVAEDVLPQIIASGQTMRLRAYLAPPAPDPAQVGAFSLQDLQDEHNRIAAMFGVAVAERE